MRNVTSLSAVALFVMLSSTNAQGQIVFSGDFAAGTGQIQLSSDYTFTLTSPLTLGTTAVLVFDEAVTTVDAGNDTAASQSGTPLGLTMGSMGYTASFTFRDNILNNTGSLTPKDAYMYWSSPASANSGETVTVKAGTYKLNTSSGINPEFSSKSFGGNLFLANGSTGGTRISGDVSAVPEPRDYALLTGIGLVGFAVARRRKTSTAEA